MPRALMQAVPDTYVDATAAERPDTPIDLASTRRQHAAVVEGMQWLGYETTVLPPDDAGPDAVFVEDPVVVRGPRVAMLQSAHVGRVAEGLRLRPVLVEWGLAPVDMDGFARMDGGDVMIVGDHAWAGLSARTNPEGIAALRRLLHVPVTPVSLPKGVLHLKCDASPLGDGRILATAAMAGCIGLPAVIVPDEERYAANCVARAGRVLCADGYPRTADALAAAGFEVRLVDTSEFRKGDGSLTCLSIRVE